jgi:biofilm PGA synthesis N-glycosyltransferase PgaC
MGDDTPPPTLEEIRWFHFDPCFNEGINARETIGAAMAQRYKNIEVIAINDGSTDDTHDVLEQLAIEYPSLRVIHLAENQGKALALKTGAAAARSDYLCVLMAMRYWIAMPWRIWSLR